MTPAGPPLDKALARERERRRRAEQALEKKSLELYNSYTELEQAHQALKDNQNQLIQSEKMASLGVLSAGVAHEINNPIGFVLSNINTLSTYAPAFQSVYRAMQALVESIRDDPRYAEQCANIMQLCSEHDIDFLLEDTAELLPETQKGLSRVRDIVNGLKAFAHAESSEMKPLDLNECLRATIALAQNQLKHSCELRIDLAPELPCVHANKGKIGQVFMNMLVNAGQALDSDGDGQITITSAVTEKHVVISIADNGHGISEENLAKLFTPFFTTKTVGEGTGLGLSISFGIMQEHRGHIEVDSSVGLGTCFRLFFPAQEAVSESD
ncbi:MAG: ATP-binding protein [Pseudomonadota bacterium]